MSPELIKTLEENQVLLCGARDCLNTLKARKELGIPSWKFSSMPSVAEADAPQRFRKSQYSAFPRDPDRVPEILDRVLTEFSMIAVFRRDRIDIIGGIELEILDSDACLHASKMGEGWGDGKVAQSVNGMLSMAFTSLSKTFPSTWPSPRGEGISYTCSPT